MTWLVEHARTIWLCVAYAFGVLALGVALGKRIKSARISQEELDAMNRRRLGL